MQGRSSAVQNQCAERSGQEVAKLKELRAHMLGAAEHIEGLSDNTELALSAAIRSINAEIDKRSPDVDALKMQTVEAIITAKGDCSGDINCCHCPIDCKEGDKDKDILRKARRWKAEHE